MKIKIICVGKLKEKYLKDGIEEYIKRLKRFAETEILEIPDEKIPDNASVGEKNIVISKEGEKILKVIGKNDYIISLCVEGKQMDSEAFARQLSEITTFNSSSISFIIGGSLGIDEKVKNISHMRLGFSKMTFPHQLMRLVLVEQIYRAFKINNNEEYHK